MSSTIKISPGGLTSRLVGAMTFGLTSSLDRLGNYQVLAGKSYRLNEKGMIRVNLSLGVGYTTIREPTNWQPIEGSLINGSHDSTMTGMVL